jgi:hypothetical protein
MTASAISWKRLKFLGGNAAGRISLSSFRQLVRDLRWARRGCTKTIWTLLDPGPILTSWRRHRFVQPVRFSFFLGQVGISAPHMVYIGERH